MLSFIHTLPRKYIHPTLHENDLTIHPSRSQVIIDITHLVDLLPSTLDSQRHQVDSSAVQYLTSLGDWDLPSLLAGDVESGIMISSGGTGCQGIRQMRQSTA